MKAKGRQLRIRKRAARAARRAFVAWGKCFQAGVIYGGGCGAIVGALVCALLVMGSLDVNVPKAIIHIFLAALMGVMSGAAVGISLGVFFGSFSGCLAIGIVVGNEVLTGHRVPPERALSSRGSAEVAPALAPTGRGDESAPAVAPPTRGR